MKIRQFKAGQIIFRADEHQKEAYRIIQGKVAISKIIKGTPMLLGLFEKDDIFGELSLITDQPRYVTAQAIETTDVEVMTEEDFNNLIVKKPEEIIPYLSQLFEGVRSVLDTLVLEKEDISALLVEIKENIEPQVLFVTAVENELKRWEVTLKACNEITEEKSPQKEIIINKFPFKIGRKNLQGEINLFGSNNFNIADTVPFQVSRSHCSIQREGDRFFVCDRGSRLGTIVNDELLIHDISRFKTQLKLGENTLILGTPESRIRYTITITGKADPEKEKEIENLKSQIDLAIADGILSKEEFEDLKTTIYADKKVTTAEAALIISLMEKVTKGEIKLEQ